MRKRSGRSTKTTAKQQAGVGGTVPPTAALVSLPSGMEIRVDHGALHVLVANTPGSARWVDVASTAQACQALAHLAREVVEGLVDAERRLPDGHDLWVRRGAIRVRVADTGNLTRNVSAWVPVAQTPNDARVLAELADRAAHGPDGEEPGILGALAGALVGGLFAGPLGVLGGALVGGVLGAPEDDRQREMTPEEYEGTPADPDWESQLNEVAAAEAVRRVKELAKPLQNDQPVNAADYFDLAERLIGGIDVDAIVPTTPTEEDAVAAIWLLRPYVNDPQGTDPSDFVDRAVRVLHDTNFLQRAGAPRAPTNDGRDASGYRCWVLTQRRPRKVTTWTHTRKADAIREVREAVKKHQTEGGVTCDDPRKPLEVQLVWKRDGTIQTTKL